MIQKMDQSKTCSSIRVLMSTMIAVVIIVGASMVLMSVKPVEAVAKPIMNAHILVHFDLTRRQQMENITLEPDGAADMTFASAREIVQVTLDGKMHVLMTLPAPATGGSAPILGGTFVSGIVRACDGVLYFNYNTGTSDLTGIWRLRPGSHTLPERIAALPANGLANGLALDTHTQMLYATDSALGVIRRVSIHGGIPTIWANGSELARSRFLGVNGIKVHNGAVWATNMDAATLLRIPIRHDGKAGKIEVKAMGLVGIDDFTFTGNGDALLAALDQLSQLALVHSDGTHTLVLTAANGLSNPTSVAVRGNTLYVPSAAYFTKKDPNLLVAQI